MTNRYQFFKWRPVTRIYDEYNVQDPAETDEDDVQGTENMDGQGDQDVKKT